MANFVADDFKIIAETGEYLRGERAALDGAERIVPDDCKHRLRWLDGYDAGKAAKAKTE